MNDLIIEEWVDDEKDEGEQVLIKNMRAHCVNLDLIAPLLIKC